MSNTETYLAYLAGDYTGELPQPRPIRNEMYLAALCGLNVGELPQPRQIWTEMYLYELAQNGGIGGGGDNFKITDGTYLFYGGARSDNIPEVLKLCGKLNSASYMFGDCTRVKEVDLTGLDISNSNNLDGFFNGCQYLSTVKGLGTLNTSSAQSMESFFYGCSALKSVAGVESWDIGKVTSLVDMFSGCRLLESVGNLSSWDVSKVTSMSGMFRDSGISNFDFIKKWNPESLTNAGYMFYGTPVTDISALKNLLSVADTNKLKDISYIFRNCAYLASADFSDIDMSKIQRAYAMFDVCINLLEITGVSFFGNNGNGSVFNFPTGSKSLSVNKRPKLHRLTFRTDLAEGVISFNYDIDVKYDNFERSGAVEMFGTLPTITTPHKITLTGNPCITGKTRDGATCEVLTAEDKAIATSKGWTIVG